MTTLATRKLNPRKITTNWARLLAASRWVSTWFLRSWKRETRLYQDFETRWFFGVVGFETFFEPLILEKPQELVCFFLWTWGNYIDYIRLCVWNLPNSWCITYVDFQDVDCYHGKIASQLASHHLTYKILTPQQLSLKRPSRDGKMPSLATAIGGGLSIGKLPLLFV